MSDAQAGLLTAAPLIIIFALGLYRMRVLSFAGTFAAVSASIVIAAALFLTQ